MLHGRQTVEEWSVKSTSSAAEIDTIDRTSGSEGVGRRKDEEDAKECDVECSMVCARSRLSVTVGESRAQKTCFSLPNPNYR